MWADQDASIRVLVPLNRLPRAAQNTVLSRSRMRSLTAGQDIFLEAVQEDCSYYLLSGSVEYLRHGRVAKVVDASDDVARRPLNRPGPHRYTCRARSACTVLGIVRSLLETQIALTEATAQRDDGAAVDAGNWMARMLRSQVFAHLPAANIRSAFARMQELPVRANEVVLHQGEPGECYFVVREGVCDVSHRPPGSTQDVHLADLGPGDGFGEESLVSGRPRNATVTMLSDGRLMRLSRADFVELICQPLLRPLRVAAALEQVERGALWLDLRSAEQCAHRPLRNSVNIPAAVLRNRARKLPPDERYVACSADPIEARTGAFLLAQRGFDVGYLEASIDEVIERRAEDGATVGEGRQSMDNQGVVSFPRGAQMQEESPVAQEAREVLEERTAPPAAYASSVQHQAAAGSLLETALHASLSEAVAHLPMEPTPVEASRKEADEITALLQSIEHQVRDCLQERLLAVRQRYEEELAARTDRIKQQAVKEILRRDAEREARYKAAYSEKEKLLRQHYRKLIELANRIGSQREQLLQAREQLKQRIQQSNDLQREVQQMRSVLAQSIGQLDDVPSDKVLNRSIRTLLTG